MQTRQFSLLFFILLYSLSAFAQSRTDHALFFVTTDFDYWTDFPRSTARQVEAIANELKTNYGFQTEIVYNQSRRQILNKLIAYQQKRFGAKDQLLVYFSQHGHYEEGATGALIPKDGLQNDPTYDSWIRHPLLADLVDGIRCQHILLALDACYSGTFGGGRGKPEKKDWEYEPDCTSKTDKALFYKSRLFLSSGGKERTPTDSQFADKWLEALRIHNNEGVLSFPKLYGILSEANPRPHFGEFRDHDKGGDFVFVHRSKCEPVSSITDEQHFQQTQQQPTQTAIFEHIRLFPNCNHETAISNLLAKNIQTPSTPNSSSSEKRNVNGKKIQPTDLDKMVFVQGGTFQMGSKDGDDDEKPVHSVTVSDFYMARHEVTFDEFDAFCNAAGKDLPDDESWGRANRPAINVSWYDAIEYCNWKSEQQRLQPVYTVNEKNITANWNANGYRLPTEAEWEFAARSRGNNEKWAGTSSASQLATFGNFCDKNCTYSWATKNQNDSYKNTAPVGSFSENNLGLFDMSGNVWEWCWDWKDSNYYQKSKNSSNPKGPNTGSYRVIRGGSWLFAPSFLRCARRSGDRPSFRGNYIGFRLSRAGR